MLVPDGLFYTNDHEWLKVDGETGLIGITDFAQNELKDIVFLNIDSDLKEIKKGETFGVIEAVKTVSDMYAPVSGEVIEINPETLEHAELMNQDPYGKGWIIKIKLSDPSETESLMSADQYKKHIGL